MDKIKQSFVIKFAGLADGQHQFEFKIDEKFFAIFEYSEIKKGDVNVYLTLEKNSRMITLNFAFEGFVCLPCDICLKEINYSISAQDRLIIKFGQQDELLTEDEIWVISEKENQVDISQFLYQAIAVLRPIHLVHGVAEDGVSLCDPVMFKIFTEMKVDNNESTTEHEVDQRWSKLTELL